MTKKNNKTIKFKRGIKLNEGNFCGETIFSCGLYKHKLVLNVYKMKPNTIIYNTQNFQKLFKVRSWQHWAVAPSPDPLWFLLKKSVTKTTFHYYETLKWFIKQLDTVGHILLNRSFVWDCFQLWIIAFGYLRQQDNMRQWFRSDCSVVKNNVTPRRSVAYQFA